MAIFWLIMILTSEVGRAVGFDGGSEFSVRRQKYCNSLQIVLLP